MSLQGQVLEILLWVGSRYWYRYLVVSLPGQVLEVLLWVGVQVLEVLSQGQGGGEVCTVDERVRGGHLGGDS